MERRPTAPYMVAAMPDYAAFPLYVRERRLVEYYTRRRWHNAAAHHMYAAEVIAKRHRNFPDIYTEWYL